MIDEILKNLVLKNDLELEQAKEAMLEITEGKVSESKIASYLTALKIKGETVDEILGSAFVMREKCIKTELKNGNTLDIVGTGGDMSNTFNISTASAFVVSCADVPVAKHGNRALTSKSGSIDVLESLKINVNKTPEEEIELFNELNLCFMFAQKHHPAMKNVSSIRKSLPFRTIFNILGPLTNPANANNQLFGVYDKNLVHTLCEVISKLGVKNVIVVHGKDGIDEATLTDETMISEGRNGIIKDYVISPEEFGLKKCNKKDLAGASPDYNAQIIRNIFSGKEIGAKKDIVVLNSALAFYTFKKVKNIKEGVELAYNIINSGCAMQKLEDYIRLSNK